MHGPEPLEGGSVLEELQSELGVLLWQSLRDVMLWADTPAGARAELFAPEAAARRDAALNSASMSELALPLRTLGELVATPESIDPEGVGKACREVARWAEDREAFGTAIAFAQDAALAEPANPDAAFNVARLAIRIEDHPRAEVWFRRAISLARQTHDWRRYARAFSGLGKLYLMRGNLPAAQRFHTRALRGARRGGLRAEQAAALHDLFGIAIEMGRAADAERLAREAALAYGRANPRLPSLAHDIAYFWMQRGYFARALAVFRAVLPLVDEPSERLFVQADLMRAAGGAGQIEVARCIGREVWEKASQPEYRAGAARALVELGRGALQLLDVELAAAAATRALEIARERSEAKTRLEAEALLTAIQVKRQSGRPAPDVQPVNGGSGSADILAEELIRTLQGMANRAPDR